MHHLCDSLPRTHDHQVGGSSTSEHRGAYVATSQQNQLNTAEEPSCLLDCDWNGVSDFSMTYDRVLMAMYKPN